jgi:hypothetical protein
MTAWNFIYFCSEPPATQLNGLCSDPTLLPILCVACRRESGIEDKFVSDYTNVFN